MIGCFYKILNILNYFSTLTAIITIIVVDVEIMILIMVQTIQKELWIQSSCWIVCIIISIIISTSTTIIVIIAIDVEK